MKTCLAAILATASLIPSSGVLAQEAPANATSSAPSARVTVAPLRLEMDGEKMQETLRVINPSDRPIGIQVRAFDWTQSYVEDVYAPTTVSLVSPFIFVIQSGDTLFFLVQSRALSLEC